MKLYLIAALFVAKTYAQSCADLTTFGDTDTEKSDRCMGYTTSNECGCTWVTGNSEGCSPATCAPTTMSPTTASPTTASPSTASPTTPSPVTPSPVMTTTKSVCTCPTQAAVQTTAARTTAYYKGKHAKSKSKDKSSGGMGVGDCDCDKDFGVVELRFRYIGSETDVDIEIKSGNNVICDYANINNGDEIICNIANSNMNNFPTETSFTAGSSRGQFHTSCSSDIVDEVQGDLKCTGWRDGNPRDDNDCDDGEEPCDCDDTTATPATTNSNTDVSFVQTVIGDNCYCDDTSGAFSTTSTTSTTSYKSKKSKSKSKSSSGGLGYGDCDCDKDFGMVEMRLIYSGDENVDISYIHKDGGEMCKDEDVAKGDESTCSVANSNKFDNYGTNTYVKVYSAGTSKQICMSTIHTSCSDDIVGGYGDEGCGYDLQVSGWRDGNPRDDNDCDDGEELCDCEGVFVDEPEDPTEEEVVTYGDQCFCSNVDATSSITSVADLTALTTTAASSKSKRSNQNGWGFGYCDCDGGLVSLKFVYKGTEAATISMESKNGVAMCSFDGVVYGDENECTLPSSMTKFSTDTYVTVATSSDSCTDSIHTSCSSDIIGWTAGDCTSVVVSGWQDKNSAGACDDGFDPCDCETVNECYFDSSSGELMCLNQDGTEDGCNYDEGGQTCTQIVGFYSNGVELVGGVVAVATAAVVAVMAM